MLMLLFDSVQFVMLTFDLASGEGVAQHARFTCTCCPTCRSNSGGGSSSMQDDDSQLLLSPLALVVTFNNVVSSAFEKEKRGPVLLLDVQVLVAGELNKRLPPLALLCLFSLALPLPLPLSLLL